MMQRCTACNTKSISSAPFCRSCGANLSMGFTGLPSLEESRQRYHNLRACMKDRAAKRNTKVITLVVLLLAGAYALGMRFPVLALCLFPLFFLVDANRWLRKSEYYEIPGSSTPRGEHRCIFCGGRGIYRKGQYKSNAKFASCSKCSAPHFAE
jgi:hypothetical protein